MGEPLVLLHALIVAEGAASLTDGEPRREYFLLEEDVPGGGVSDWGHIREAISRCGSWYSRRVLGLELRDLTGGFKCFRAEVLRAMSQRSGR